MKPRKNYRSRPKKTEAKRKQRLSVHKRKLIDSGYKEEDLKRLNVVEIRALLKTTAKKTAKTARQEKKKAQAAAVKTSVKKDAAATKNEPSKKTVISEKKD